MPYHWPEDTQFEELTLEVEDKDCPECSRTTTICDHRFHHVSTDAWIVILDLEETYAPGKIFSS
ncbi:MAG: hypothetical protein FVQ79_09835 [Planctomycetes bacterium]|nr:hypothetical protein [Planctomycetota bacterium]